jgi:N-methylhydantoinase B
MDTMAVLNLASDSKSSRSRSYDLNVDLVRESLVALVNEMRANVIYSSYSSVIYEGHDFSCCLMLADGRQAAMGRDDHPLHMFAVPTSTSAILERFAGDIRPGDTFLHNEPYTGGTHLNDILMLYPIFWAGELKFFSAIRAHWNDVGGMTPGSLSGQVTEIYQEGICIPPIKIADQGQLNTALLDVLMSNMRLPHERRGDFECMLGASKKAELRVQELFQRYGGEAMTQAIELLLARSENVMRRRIAELPDGTYRAETYIESNGHTPDPLRIRLALTIAGDRMIADFSGTSPQTAGPTNVGPSMAKNAVFTIAKAFLDPESPINHGAFAPIEVFAPPGSFINAKSPAPCGGMAEVKFTIDSVVSIALARALPNRRVGDLKGTANHFHVSGYCNNDRFILYEWPAGGTGATDGLDGNNAVRTFTEGDFNSVQSVETIEAAMPLRIERCEIRQDSCGDGKYRGGFGLRRQVRLLTDAATLCVISDRNVIPPYSVNGGAPSACNRFTVKRDGRDLKPSRLPGKVSDFRMCADDILCVETAGGGGYGLPLERDPAAVLTDVRGDYLSVDAARDRYGVVIRDSEVDPKATQILREEIASRSLRLDVAARQTGRGHGSRRLAYLASETGDRLGLHDGILIELAPPKGAPLRCWIRYDKSVSPDVLHLDEDAFALLEIESRKNLPVRVLHSIHSIQSPEFA